MLEIGHFIDGKRVPGKSGRTADVWQPMDGTVRGRVALASRAEIDEAVANAKAAQPEWAATNPQRRARVLMKFLELVARDNDMLAEMLAREHGKTIPDAKGDILRGVEVVEFAIGIPHLMKGEYTEGAGPGIDIYSMRQPLGVVAGITPFNFPAMVPMWMFAVAIACGNTFVLKPSERDPSASLHMAALLREAGLPDGVINFVPGDPGPISEVALTHHDLAGVHFTGSTGVFNSMWETIGRNMASYKSYPRIVGETGGKDFVMAHASADPAALAVALVRGAFEYQGQKCSAASRTYVPASLWPEVEERIVAMVKAIKVGDIADFRNFMGAVIDRKAYDRISGYIERAKEKDQVIVGGKHSDKDGYFVHPTVIRTEDPSNRILCEEIFGPVLAVYVYPDAQYEQTLALVDRTSPYALTGAVFARDRKAVKQAAIALRNAAGNFYVNDKPTGAVVGQQPFGGARASGTNDKAGSILNLMRWVSPRNVKETFAPPTEYRYPFMDEE